jgi:hypothetical protein
MDTLQRPSERQARDHRRLLQHYLPQADMLDTSLARVDKFGIAERRFVLMQVNAAFPRSGLMSRMASWNLRSNC